MFKIYLCDDIPVQLMMVGDIVKESCAERGIKAEVVSFSSGEKLLSHIEKNGGADLYILDIIMPGIKGIDLGEALRAKGDKGRIVYLTASSDYAIDSYRVSAFYYILKPISRQKILDVLDRVFDDCREELSKHKDDSEQDRFLQIKTHEGKVNIRTSELCYVDIINRSPCYHMTDGREIMGTTIRGTFTDAVGRACDSEGLKLVGTHLLINIDRIARVEHDTVIFRNGIEYIPSKSALSSICELLV